jgi:hypothetical protein
LSLDSPNVPSGTPQADLTQSLEPEVATLGGWDDRISDPYASPALPRQQPLLTLYSSMLDRRWPLRTP